MMQRMVEGANADPWLRSRARFVDLALEIGVGEQRWIVTLDKNGVAAEPRQASSRNPEFSLRAAPDAWDDFCKPTPPPGTHDILALFEGERLEMDGDILPLMRNLLLVKRMLAKARNGEAQR